MFKLTKHPWKLLIVASLVLIGAIILLLETGPGISKIDNDRGKRYRLERPLEWATPIVKNGLPNFHKVSQDLYRGAQPTAAGIRQLKDMGIKTIINLRSFNSDKNKIGDVKIGYEHICMKAWHPEEEDVVRFLKIVTDKEKTPVFVHCQHGADRTGLMCAIYRVAVCGWSKESAADEMVYGGFGFHPVWKNLRCYLMNLDIEKAKDKAGFRNANSRTDKISQNRS
jgi:protein tyrosine/serine phosphatase